MEDVLAVIGIFWAIPFTLIALTKVISDNRTRRELIKAGGTEEMLEALFARKEEDPRRYTALKWGILTASVGLALVVVQFLPISFEEPDPAAYGLLFLFAGGGLLVYYAVVSVATSPWNPANRTQKRSGTSPTSTRGGTPEQMPKEAL